MQSTRPIDSDIAFAPVQPSSTLHSTSCAYATKLEKSIKHRAVISNIVLTLLLCEVVHVVWRDFV